MSELTAAMDADDASGTRGIVSRHPNASVALGSGAGLGPLVVWCVSAIGTPMPPEVGAALGGLLAATFLLVGRRGIRGVLVQAWRGSEG